MQNIDVHPENNSADFSYARFIKTTKNNAAYVNYEKIQGNLTYRYVEQRKEKTPRSKSLYFRCNQFNLRLWKINNHDYWLRP